MNRPLRRRTPDSLAELKPHLDRIVEQVETPDYLEEDPVQFMHHFDEKRDREIAGFLAALMAWGRRDVVNAKIAELLERMDGRPYRFIRHYKPADGDRLRGFKHRTFKPVDFHGLFSALASIYSDYPDFESFWSESLDEANASGEQLFSVFRRRFLTCSDDIEIRTGKHLSDPGKNSTCKRLALYLRWALRPGPVDTGIWDFMPASELPIPFDVHVARESRRYGLLGRKSNNWKAVRELTKTLRRLDPHDPVQYDFALFGIGAMGYKLPARFLLNRV